MNEYEMKSLALGSLPRMICVVWYWNEDEGKVMGDVLPVIGMALCERDGEPVKTPDWLVYTDEHAAVGLDELVRERLPAEPVLYVTEEDDWLLAFRHVADGESPFHSEGKPVLTPGYLNSPPKLTKRLELSVIRGEIGWRKQGNSRMDPQLWAAQDRLQGLG